MSGVREITAYLRKYNAWRRGDDERTMDEAGILPEELGRMIDAAVELLEARAQGDAEPVWTPKPHRPGRYLVRGFDDSNTEAMVCVAWCAVESELICNLHDSNSDDESKYSNLMSEISDRFEWSQLYTHPPSAGVTEGWKECLEELIEAMRIYQMDYDEDPPYKHKAMMSRARALLDVAPQPPQEGE